MKKLKVVLVLLFAMCSTLFLFSCKPKEELKLKEITISGMKTAFTEADTAFSEGDLKVTATFTGTEDPEKAQRVLTSTEYTIDHSALDTALKNAQDKKYSAARGTYDVTVSYTSGQLTRTAKYSATVDHAYGAKDGEGYETCSVCGAKRMSKTVDESITIDAWTGGDTVYTAQGADPIGTLVGGKYVNYASIGMGQQLVVTGTGEATETNNTYYFPITGVANGRKGVVVRNDLWTIYDGPASLFQWPNHTAGSDVKTEEMPENAAEWDIYRPVNISGSTADYPAGANTNLQLIWNFREDGVMEFSINNIDAGKLVVNYMKVPNATYDCVLFGEYFKYHITQVDIIQNLVLEDFKLDKAPAKTEYAENNMIELDEQGNIVGVEANAYYNQSTSPVTVQISSYDIVAYTGTGDEKVEHDLRTETLKAGMHDFAIRFSGKELPISLTVTPSIVRYVTADSYFHHGDQDFLSEDATFTYDSVSGKITAIGSGYASSLTDAQKQALNNTSKSYFVAVRLFGLNALTKVEGAATGLITDIQDGGINVIIPVDAADLKSYELTVVREWQEGEPENQTTKSEKTLVAIDLSGIKIPEFSSQIVKNETTLDKGGEITVRYTGDVSKLTADDTRYFLGGQNVQYKNVKDGAGKIGTIDVKFQSGTGYIDVTYVLPALDVASTNFQLTRNAGVYTSGKTIATADAATIICYNLTVSEGSAWHKINDTTYLAASGTTLAVVALEPTHTLAGAGATVSLNIQNPTAQAYDLSFTASEDGVAFRNANSLTISSAVSTQLLKEGTIGNNDDYDYGAVYLARVEITSELFSSDNNEYAPLDITAGYYVEVVGTNDGTSYKILHVTATKIEEQTVTASGNRTGTEPTCIVDGCQYYEQSGFRFGQIAKAADGAHDWQNGVCSKCGSKKVGEETKAGYEVGPIENATKNGFSITFDITGNAADWGSAVINPYTSANHAKSGLLITLPNLDPFGNSVGFSATNAYPGVAGSTLYNGFAYNAFQTKDETVTATITVHPVTGVTFYRNGVKVVNYAVTGTMSDNSSSIGELVNLILQNVEANGFAFADGDAVGTVSNLIVYTAGLSEGQVIAERESAEANTTVYLQNKEFGNSSYSVSWVPLFGTDAEGQNITLKPNTQVKFWGNHYANGTQNWFVIIPEISGEVDGKSAGYTMRADRFGWTYGDGWTTDGTPYSLAPTMTATMNGGEDVGTMEEEDVNAFWANYIEIAKNCQYSVTFTWTGSTVTCEIAFYGASTYVCTFTFDLSGAPSQPASFDIHLNGEQAWYTLYAVSVKTLAQA